MLKEKDFKKEKVCKNTTFVFNFNDFAQNICQKLPFSNILILITETEFFEFGIEIYNKLSEKGNKVQSVVLKDNNLLQLDDFLKEKDLISEFRGVVAINKQILCHILSSDFLLPKIFYLQTTTDIYGIFESNEKTKVEYYFYITDIDKCRLLKNFAVRTLCLIDCLFYHSLTENQIDQHFFSKAKRQIISAILSFNDNKENNDEIFDLLIMLEKTFGIDNKIKCFSANVTSYLMQKNLYCLDTNFLASKQIIKKYKALLKNKFQSQISYSERARIVSFFINEKISNCLLALCKQLDKINIDVNFAMKAEIKNLIKVYDALISLIEKLSQSKSQDNNVQNNINQQKLKMCVSVCGDTHLSINGMTLARQISFLQ